MSSPSLTKRACDACHKRKVKCVGTQPCQVCQAQNLNCTYDIPPQKKGPKGSRAKIISELRKSQEQSSSKAQDALGSLSAGASPTFARQPEPLSRELVDTCIAEFFDKMYTTVPILHRGWIQQRASEVPTSPESYCILGALCVFVVVQLRVSLPTTSSSFSSGGIKTTNSLGLRLVEDVRRMRIETDYSDNPTTGSIITSFFLSAALFSLEKHTMAWYYMQEAITMVKIIRLQQEESYGAGGPTDAMNRRLFWILFISERAQALHKHRDILLHETIDFPQPDPDEPLDELGINGLTCLYKLFRCVDDRFSEAWTKLRSSTQIAWPQNTAIWLATLQKQLATAVPPDLNCTKIQEADLRVTQQWLRLVVWQLSTASHSLSSAAQDESMTLLYPMKLSNDLAEVLRFIDVQAMDVHGIGLVEKLFDIAYSLADIIGLDPGETGTYEVGPKDHLATFLNLVTTLRNGDTKFVELLKAKIREALPTLAISLGIPLQPPTPSSTHSASSSGIAGQPLIPPMSHIEGTDSSVTSPYGSPPALSSTPQLASATMSYAVGRQIVTSSPAGGDPAMAMSMSAAQSMASPTGSASESGMSESLAPPRSMNPYPPNFRPGSGFGS